MVLQGGNPLEPGYRLGPLVRYRERPMNSTSPHFLVVGCGGIGGVVMAGLLEQGLRVTAVAKRAEIAQALKTHGVRIKDENGERTVRGELTVHEELPSSGAYDFALLAVQPN